MIAAVSTRFAIRRDAWVRPLLLVGGAIGANSYLELTPAGLRVRFGLLFDNTIALAAIVSVAPRGWLLWNGLGWRVDLRGLVALVGSCSGVVELRLRSRRRLRGVLPWPGGGLPCDRLVVSLEQPDAFIAALQRVIVDR